MKGLICVKVRGLTLYVFTGCFKDSNDRALPQNKELASRGYALMTTCTKMAVQDKSAGFCIEANLACELPNPGSDLDSFWKAASSKGQSTFACDPTYPNGADWTMVRRNHGVEDEHYLSLFYPVSLMLCESSHLQIFRSGFVLGFK